MPPQVAWIYVLKLYSLSLTQIYNLSIIAQIRQWTAIHTVVNHTSYATLESTPRLRLDLGILYVYYSLSPIQTHEWYSVNFLSHAYENVI